jgi:hypothetical protein
MRAASCRDISPKAAQGISRTFFFGARDLGGMPSRVAA